MKQWPRPYEQTSRTGFMRGSRNFCRGGGGGGGGGGGSRPNGQKTVGGGGGGGGRGPTARKQSGQCFISHQLKFTIYRVDPMVLLQRGGGGPTSSRGWGCPKKPI